MEYLGTWKIFVQTRQTLCSACFPGVPISSPLAGLRRHRSDRRERLCSLPTLSLDAAYSTEFLVCLCSLFSGRFLQVRINEYQPKRKIPPSSPAKASRCTMMLIFGWIATQICVAHSTLRTIHCYLIRMTILTNHRSLPRPQNMPRPPDMASARHPPWRVWLAQKTA